jgi:hypothetical protein
MTASGIEYPGIVGINHTYYDLSGNVAGVPTQVMLESVVAHEAGHQWFYNVVGNDQINEPWVDESLDQYITGLYFLDTAGRNGYQGYRSSWLSRLDRVGRANIPIGMPAASYKGAEYGAIVLPGPRSSKHRRKDGQATFDRSCAIIDLQMKLALLRDSGNMPKSTANVIWPPSLNNGKSPTSAVT